MARFYKQDCPLCGASAEYCFVDARNRKYFKCPKCISFQISRRAEDLLAEQVSQWRRFYASKAPLAPSEHMLVICMSSHESRQESGNILQATFVNKEELPLNCE